MPGIQDDPGASFAALKQPVVEALARILYFKHATITSKTLAACASWLHIQRRQIGALHEASIRRQGTLSLMADVFIRGAFSRPHEVLQAQSTAALCRHHRELNPHVLSALMALVAEESTVRADEVRACLDEKKQQQQQQQQKSGQEDDEAVAELWLRSMSRIAVLWMGKSRWEAKMRRALDVPVPPCARYNDCTACKLAVVGGSRQFLMDLRTSLLARHKRHERNDDKSRPKSAATPAQSQSPPPLLLRMVEAWIDVCYDARKRHHIRSESDLMARVVARVRGAAMSVAGRREEGRMYTRSGWPMPLAPLMEVSVDAHVIAGARGHGEEEEEEGEDDEEYVAEDGCIAGRWRWRRRTGQKDGYSQYLRADGSVRPPADSVNTTRAAAKVDRAAEDAPSATNYRPPVCDSDVSDDQDKNNDHVEGGGGGGSADNDGDDDMKPLRPNNDPNPPAPPCEPLRPVPPAPQRHRSVHINVETAEAGASRSCPGEPWHADYERYILRSQPPSSSPSPRSEAPLSAIYEAYKGADAASAASSSSKTSLHAPSSIFTQSFSGLTTAATGAAMVASSSSSPSPSEYSSVGEKDEAATQKGRDDVPAPAPAPAPPPPAPPGRGPRSGIPLPRRMGGRRQPTMAQDGENAVYTMSLLGYGREGKQRRAQGMF